jgi:hypothetical protein
MAHWEFPGSAPIDVFIDLPAGRVALAAEPTDITTVELTAFSSGRGERLIADVQVSFDDGRLEVVGPRRSGLWRGNTGLDLTVTLPPGSRCKARTASADVSCTGDVADLDVHTASGDVTAAAVAGYVQIETASGDIRLGEAGADAEMRSAGGDVRLARAGGDVWVRTASGDVNIGTAAVSVTVQTASGDVRIGSVAAGSTEVTTASGGIVVGVAAGVAVYLDLGSVTGSTRSQLDEADASDDVPLEVRCRAVSGDIRIVRASGEPGWRRSVPGRPALNTPETPPPAG